MKKASRLPNMLRGKVFAFPLLLCLSFTLPEKDPFKLTIPEEFATRGFNANNLCIIKQGDSLLLFNLESCFINPDIRYFLYTNHKNNWQYKGKMYLREALSPLSKANEQNISGPSQIKYEKGKLYFVFSQGVIQYSLYDFKSTYISVMAKHRCIKDLCILQDSFFLILSEASTIIKNDSSVCLSLFNYQSRESVCDTVIHDIHCIRKFSTVPNENFLTKLSEQSCIYPSRSGNVIHLITLQNPPDRFGDFKLYTRAISLNAPWKQINYAQADSLVAGTVLGGISGIRNASGYVWENSCIREVLALKKDRLILKVYCDAFDCDNYISVYNYAKGKNEVLISYKGLYKVNASATMNILPEDYPAVLALSSKLFHIDDDIFSICSVLREPGGEITLTFKKMY